MASPEILAMPKDIVAKMETKGVKIEYRDNIMDAVKDADVIYMTRVQRERFEDINEYNAVKDMFIMDGEVVKNFKKDAIIMHPLPRINEITIDVDEYPGAAYFRQARNGLPVRMAMLALVCGVVGKGQK
jgi:aspartate carbamoyltransferase catalytic subunit